MSAESLYFKAKDGLWDELKSIFVADPASGRAAVRFVKPSSGWTMLHQAAWWGSEDGVRLCVANGAQLTLASKDNRETPLQVAKSRGHLHIVALLERAVTGTGSLWMPLEDPTIWPSSCSWDEARLVDVDADMVVAYAGGRVEIPKGAKRYADSFGRTLVGWHGTWDPPLGMDGERMCDTGRQLSES
ncbi:hypothetical protein M427DRAFT_52930 [Gonapodya prolifera JEL478]|uniref:Uncharacterized protein n=1 Tax=Gonapodya prolifera (strain JEL478) TaxID=1344416 RepID=A0A139ARY9_GONPJ|nr:hypothetical protein M427DRAFT_52930 [Gonapodya prolifera JEL478]|eukprot:KXS19502.1 hypothetical protein M427DRAFT_52930 [Gonapodya prolifera JEL478]